jgi:hypothetical protein
MHAMALTHQHHKVCASEILLVQDIADRDNCIFFKEADFRDNRGKEKGKQLTRPAKSPTMPLLRKIKRVAVYFASWRRRWSRPEKSFFGG